MIIYTIANKTLFAGDILIFLTGRSEIDTVCEMIFSEAEDIDYSEEVRKSVPLVF